MLYEVYYSCSEHIEYVLEDFINNYEEIPDFQLVDINSAKCCRYCYDQAMYFVTKGN